MADQPKKKRSVKNPETFRERALKAADTDSKPGRLTSVKQVGGKAAQPVGSFGRKLWGYRVVRIIATPFRLIGKVLIPTYVRNSWNELRLVTWPGFRLSLRLTFAVIVFAIIFGAAVAGVDYVLDKAFRQILT